MSSMKLPNIVPNIVRRRHADIIRKQSRNVETNKFGG